MRMRRGWLAVVLAMTLSAWGRRTRLRCGEGYSGGTVLRRGLLWLW